MKAKRSHVFQAVSIVKLLILSLLLSGCSGAVINHAEDESLALLPADDLKQGPGVFSGEKGAFYIIGGEKKPKPQTRNSVPSNTVSVKNKNLAETSDLLEDKIRQLEKDKIELELLKRQVDKKIRSQ